MDIIEQAEAHIEEVLVEEARQRQVNHERYVAEANVLLEELSTRVGSFNATLRARGQELGVGIRIFGIVAIHVHTEEGGGDGPSPAVQL